MKNCSPEHNPRTCAECCSMRHPSKQAARRALSAIPRQTRGTQRGNGGGY